MMSDMAVVTWTVFRMLHWTEMIVALVMHPRIAVN